MSYERRGGGHRRRNRDDYEDRRRETYVSPDEKLKTLIIRWGDVDALEELPSAVRQIREHTPPSIPGISEGIRIALTEQPYKIPYYATLLRQLCDPPNAEPISGPSLGRAVLEDFWKGFQAYLDKLAWRETRLCVQFFAHLTVAKLVSPDSMLTLLQSFTAVLDEFGVSHDRAKRASLCAAEGLMICGSVLSRTSASRVSDIVNVIEAYNDTTVTTKWIVQPTLKIYTEVVSADHADELLDSLLNSLKILNQSGFAETATSFPQPYLTYPDPDPATSPPFNLPSILVPPEIIELGGLSSDTGEDALVKKEEMPEYYLRLFDDDVTPNPNTPAGYAVRTVLLDIIDIFEVNRRECARLLLEYPKWCPPGTFRPKPGSGEVEPVPGKHWQLESTIIETIIGSFLVLPESAHKPIYHISLITELCKLSPPTVGPAVGKSIRKLYASLADGLDVEAARRFAEWFAVHMSNFGFQWVWKEWIPDLALSVQHPRRAFMRRAIEFEIRLSYHDRILKTLPDVMQAPNGYTIPETAPGPNFEFDEPSHPHHDAAQAVLNLFRGRAKADDVITHLDILRTSLEASEEGHINVDALVRSIAIQSLLHIGSRSFSHLLNAIERYLPLIRKISGAGTTAGGAVGNAEAKSEILSAAASFWKHNRQMVGIVFDKLMQYQIVDPTDVVGWTFLHGAGIGETSGSAAAMGPLSLNAFEWDLMKAALDKANGRVMIARRKVTALRKEDDVARAKVQTNNNIDTMEVDAEIQQDENVRTNPVLETALKAFTSLTREQKTALSKTLEGFVSCLAPAAASDNPNPSARTVIPEAAWNNRANWNGDEWNAWETWGWYRQFCRMYSPYLRNYSNTLWAVSFERFNGSTDPAALLLIRIWNVATGQDT